MRNLQDLPMFPIFPFVPLFLGAGLIALEIATLVKLRRLSQRLDALTAAQPLSPTG